MGSALLFIVRSRLLVYSAGSGVNRVQVVLSGFNKRLFCFVQAKTLCMYGSSLFPIMFLVNRNKAFGLSLLYSTLLVNYEVLASTNCSFRLLHCTYPELSVCQLPR